MTTRPGGTPRPCSWLGSDRPGPAVRAVLLLGGAAVALGACSASIESTARPAEVDKTEATPTARAPGDTIRSEDVEDQDSAGPYLSSSCTGSDLDITQAGSTVFMDGSCATVSITASDVFLDVEVADRLVVTGDNSTVWVGAVGDVVVSGSDNYISFDETTGTVDDNGSGNTIFGP